MTHGAGWPRLPMMAAARTMAMAMAMATAMATAMAVVRLASAQEPAATTAQAPSACTVDRAIGTTVERAPFLVRGYGMRWNLATDRLAFMEPDASGYYRVVTMRPDGSDRRRLAEGLPQVPTMHQGSPFWHPSGRYVLFVAQKAQWHGPRLFGNPDYEALPGFGRHDDLWLASVDGRQAWKLTDEPNTRDEGVLLPVFAPDGKTVAWSARQPGGKYALIVADFVERPMPHLENRRTYRPGGAAYYEPGSFTSDGRSLLYASDQDTHSFWQSQIYRMDLATGESRRLTTGKAYNEHPVVLGTPGGDWVVYMSTRGVDRFPRRVMLGTDWYAMRPDGSGTKRLTTMNVDRKDNPQNFGDMQVATTVAVSPRGDFVLGDVQDDLARQTGLVRVVRFTCP